MRKFILICSFFTILTFLLPLDVAAHANFVESDPAPNSVVEQAPTTARIRFSEPLETSYSRVVLNSGDSGPVSTADSRVDPEDAYVLLLDLPALPQGQYTLQWRTLSQVDGHSMQGFIPFAIGDPSAVNAPLVLPPPLPNPLALPPLDDVVVRWISALTLAVLIGSQIFRLYVWEPNHASETATDAFDGWTARLELIAAVGAVVATIAALLLASYRAETSLLTFMTGSRVGMILVLRLALTLGLLAVIWRVVEYRAVWVLSLGISALLSLSLLSHSAVPQTEGSAVANALTTGLAILLDLLHLLGTAAWVGGLPAMGLGLLALRHDDSGTRNQAATLTLARFTALATAAIMILATTGTFAALQHMSSISELWTTTYGLALLLKLGLFGLLLLLGGYNRWRLGPLLGRAAHTTATLQTMRRIVGGEAAISVALLLAVGVLTAVAPARSATASGGKFADTARVGDVTLGLQVAPDNIVSDVFALDVHGLPDGAQPEVLLRASMPTHDMGAQDLPLTEVEPGRWGARGALVAMPGPWNVEAIVRASGMSDLRHSFIVDTSLPTESAAQQVTLPAWSLLLIAALLMVALSQIVTGRTWQYRIQTSSLVLVLAAFVASVVPYYVTEARAPNNPFESTPEVLAAGKTIYQQNCVACHGITGRGDGPAARSLPGLPGDFTAPHFATHTDTQIYGWIRDGKPATAMPAFNSKLNDEQIWQAITYIRQLYADAQ